MGGWLGLRECIQPNKQQQRKQQHIPDRNVTASRAVEQEENDESLRKSIGKNPQRYQLKKEAANLGLVSCPQLAASRGGEKSGRGCWPDFSRLKAEASLH